MPMRFPYSQEAIDFALEAHYPQLKDMQAHAVLLMLAQDFFCGKIALERFEYLAVRTALDDYNVHGVFRPVDHKTYMAATDQDDDVIDNLTKEERHVAVSLASCARRHLIANEGVSVEIGNVYRFRPSGHDDCFRVVADASIDVFGETTTGWFSATFDHELNIVQSGCYSEDSSGENLLAAFDGDGKKAVASWREKLIARHGINFTPALTI